MTKKKTDMTVSVQRVAEDGQEEMKEYRIWSDQMGALYVKMNDSFVRLTEVVGAFKEARLNA